MFLHAKICSAIDSSKTRAQIDLRGVTKWFSTSVYEKVTFFLSSHSHQRRKIKVIFSLDLFMLLNIYIFFFVSFFGYSVHLTPHHTNTHKQIYHNKYKISHSYHHTFIYIKLAYKYPTLLNIFVLFSRSSNMNDSMRNSRLTHT